MLLSTNSLRAQHGGLRNRCSRRRQTIVAGIPEFFKDFFNFNSWAPRSTKIWRLNQYAYTEGDLIRQGKDAEESEDDLEAEFQARQAALGVVVSAATSKVKAEAEASFSQVEDSQIAASFSRRVAQVAALGPAAEDLQEDELAAPLSGGELRELIATKYGKTHDVSIVRRDIPGKTLVSLNIMWNHMEQRSFKLTEKQYMEKLDSVAYVVSALQQAPRVRSFLRAPARAERGLPARPVVGTAISIRLDLEDAVIKEWFGTGYQ